MKINKKVLFGAGVIVSILLVSKMSIATDLQMQLENYYSNYSTDFLGRKFEKILFENILDASIKAKQTDAEIIEKLKFILDDIKTLPIQTKCLFKIFTDEVNSLTYLGLGGTAYIKVSIGEKAFNDIVLKLVKIIFK